MRRIAPTHSIIIVADMIFSFLVDMLIVLSASQSSGARKSIFNNGIHHEIHVSKIVIYIP
jgi:hypothetical protein